MPRSLQRGRPVAFIVADRADCGSGDGWMKIFLSVTEKVRR